MTIPLLTDPALLEHDPGPRHPERPERLEALINSLEAQPIAGSEVELCSATAKQQHALLVHDQEYLDLLERARGKRVRLDVDTSTSERSVELAYRAAGIAHEAVDRVLRGEATRAVALVRPPGHHAEADRAMGFCLLNNVAIAAARALAERALRRILIVDWDVHHGNGTQHLFENRRDVLFFSVHRGDGFYPGTGDVRERGVGDGYGYTVNATLPPGSGDTLYTALFDHLLTPIARAFKPQLILVSAGFDAHRSDPLGGMSVTEQGFALLCSRVQRLADEHCAGKLVLVLEGGYDLGALVASARACIEVLGGHQTPSILQFGTLREGHVLETRIPGVVRSLRRAHSACWPVLSEPPLAG